MKVWVFVEGEGESKALTVLFEGWRKRLRDAGWGLPIIPLDNKAQLLRKIGWRVAEKLCADQNDLAIGLPDLYPSREYETTEFKHRDIEELRQVQTRQVNKALQNIYGLGRPAAAPYIERFFPNALKHDLEVLLLAAQGALRSYLKTRDRLGGWRSPVEDQDQDNPPKRVVEELFRVKLKRVYRDTKDAPAILRGVSDLKTVLYGDSQQIQCPVFKEMLDWVGRKTGVHAY